MSLERALKELNLIEQWLHQEAVAEHNADDSRTAFAVARDHVSDRLKELRQEDAETMYEDAEDDFNLKLPRGKNTEEGRDV